MSTPVWFQQWFLNQSSGNAAQAAYVQRVEADGGVVASLGCVPLAVWDWAAPSFVGLLDLFPNAAAAYSLRKLRAAYSGSAVRVRKEVSSVSSETDIGSLADGTLDTATLLTFASDADGGNVFVPMWYDQSLSNDATQSTASAQAKIVDGGSLVADNGKPAIEFDGTNDFMNLDSSVTLNDFTMSFVIKMNLASPTNFEGLIGDIATINSRIRMLVSTSFEGAINASNFASDATIAQQQMLLTIYRTGTTLNWYLNGSSIGTETVNSAAFVLNQIAAYNNVNFGDWTFQEFVVWPENLLSSKSLLEANVADYFGITLS